MFPCFDQVFIKVLVYGSKPSGKLEIRFACNRVSLTNSMIELERSQASLTVTLAYFILISHSQKIISFCVSLILGIFSSLPSLLSFQVMKSIS